MGKEQVVLYSTDQPKRAGVVKPYLLGLALSLSVALLVSSRSAWVHRLPSFSLVPTPAEGSAAASAEEGSFVAVVSDVVDDDFFALADPTRNGFCSMGHFTDREYTLPPVSSTKRSLGLVRSQLIFMTMAL
jgi:hypothetical protein